MFGGDSPGGPAEASVGEPIAALVVHRTRRRLRLRVPSRRGDLEFFLALYDRLRQAPEVEDLSINPTTGGVLIWHDPAQIHRMAEVLARQGRLRLCTPAHATSAATEGPALQRSPANLRLVLLLVMVGLSVRQLMRGQLLAPALTLVLYLVDLAATLRLEEELATAPVTPPATE
ncbi:hypothetical protein F2Q65_08625 [Thiohalocapsa marina]|uniref:Uncharacterized protein n=1 Tax=Thiohalocapsa marina TaxID=424902 RepID=A0A5M8FKU4_9GAMM|nr:hypothetical protein [Thiohalocapsa marina]KAA6185533.1 hypothetical protein F2Q65_08625 [Thiohalocapsa marina]